MVRKKDYTLMPGNASSQGQPKKISMVNTFFARVILQLLIAVQIKSKTEKTKVEEQIFVFILLLIYKAIAPLSITFVK